MICLDTNYLILSLIEGSNESQQLIAWYQSGEALVTPMVAWYEFLCGPVSGPQVEAMRAFISEIIPFGEMQATKAAELFDSTGRKRVLKVDAMIAATAAVSGAKLATNNVSDFREFTAFGLKLI